MVESLLAVRVEDIAVTCRLYHLHDARGCYRCPGPRGTRWDCGAGASRGITTWTPTRLLGFGFVVATHHGKGNCKFTCST
jgi:hypothetical protein